MEKLILFIAFLSILNLSHANKIIFEENGKKISLLESESLQANGNQLSYSGLIQFPGVIKANGFDARSAEFRIIVNCNNYEGTMTRIYMREKSDGTGQTFDEKIFDTANPEIFPPDSATYKTAVYACNLAKERGLINQARVGVDNDIAAEVNKQLQTQIHSLNIKKNDIAKFNNLHIGDIFTSVDGLPYKVSNGDIECDLNKNANLDTDAILNGNCKIRLFGKENPVTVSFFNDSRLKFIPIILSTVIINPDNKLIKNAIQSRWGAPISKSSPDNSQKGNNVCDLVHPNKSLIGRFRNWECKDDLNNNTTFQFVVTPSVSIQEYRKSGATLVISESKARNPAPFSLSAIEIMITIDSAQKVILNTSQLESSLKAKKIDAQKKQTAREF